MSQVESTSQRVQSSSGPSQAGTSAVDSNKPSHRPFIDPQSIDTGWYWILIPLALCISVAYKAVRVHDIRTLPRQAVAMTIQLVLGVIAIGALAFVVIEKLLPMIAPVK